MPFLNIFPDAFNQLIKGFKFLEICLLKEKILLRLLDAHEFNFRLNLLDCGIHISERYVNEESINFISIHYALRVIDIFVKPEIHLLDYILRKIGGASKRLNHLDPIEVLFCQEFKYHEII